MPASGLGGSTGAGGYGLRPGTTFSKPPVPISVIFYYDCLTHSEPALRMLMDAVGVERVVLGTDWPFDMGIDWPVSAVVARLLGGMVAIPIPVRRRNPSREP